MANSMMTDRDDYIFFWKTDEIHGWASQWYPSNFKTTISIDGEEEIIFPSAEHWMMAQKALVFCDYSMFRTIMAVTGTSRSNMTQIKALGRKVQNFDEGVWNQRREEIVLQGNILKFEQNEELKEKLLATGDKMFVEASPRDRIWGIGFGEKNAMKMKERWGLNLLGKALDKAREIIR